MTPKSAVLVMCTTLVLLMVGFANYAAVLPTVLADRHLSPAQGGFAGGAFFLAYAVASPVFAALTDTCDARRLYLIGCGFACAGGLVFPALDDGYHALLVGRTLSGLGMAGAYMPGLRLLTDAVPPDQRNWAASIYTSTITLGTSASFASAALFELLGGWPLAFTGAAAAALLGAVILAATMRAAPPATPHHHQAFKFRSRFITVLRIPEARLVALAAIGNAWEGMAFRTWWIGLLTFSAAQDGNTPWGGLNFALLSAVAGLLAMPLSVRVAAGVAAANASRGFAIITVAAASALLAGGLLVSIVDGPFPIVFALTVLYLCAIFADAGAIPPAMLTYTPAEVRGAALAVLSAASNLAAFAGTAACGFVLSIMGGTGSVNAWRAAVLSMMAGALIAIAGFWALAHKARRASLSAGQEKG